MKIFESKMCFYSRLNYPTLALLHRFLNESVSDHGGMDKIVASVLPIAHAIKDNPTVLICPTGEKVWSQPIQLNPILS